MMLRNVIGASSIALALAFAGCTSSAEKPGNSAERHSGEHAHAEEGPHGGDLIELGSEEFHAELVHPEHGDEHGEGHGDEAVTVYILDGTAEQAVAVDATDVRLNMRHGGRGEQFMLAASPESGDPAGKSSRFLSSEEALLELFHDEEVEGELVVTINGKQYRGEIEHHHDEDDRHHGHAH